MDRNEGYYPYGDRGGEFYGHPADASEQAVAADYYRANGYEPGLDGHGYSGYEASPPAAYGPGPGPKSYSNTRFMPPPETSSAYMYGHPMPPMMGPQSTEYGPPPVVSDGAPPGFMSAPPPGYYERYDEYGHPPPHSGPANSATLRTGFTGGPMQPPSGSFGMYAPPPGGKMYNNYGWHHNGHPPSTGASSDPNGQAAPASWGAAAPSTPAMFPSGQIPAGSARSEYVRMGPPGVFAQHPHAPRPYDENSIPEKKRRKGIKGAMGTPANGVATPVGVPDRRGGSNSRNGKDCIIVMTEVDSEGKEVLSGYHENGHHKSHSRKMEPGHIKRPPNAFILFRSHCCSPDAQPIPGLSGSTADKLKLHGVTDHRHVSRIVSHLWRSLTPKERAIWEERAHEAKLQHQREHPDYRYRPVYRNKSMVQKRKRNHEDFDEAVRKCETVARAILGDERKPQPNDQNDSEAKPTSDNTNAAPSEDASEASKDLASSSTQASSSLNNILNTQTSSLNDAAAYNGNTSSLSNKNKPDDREEESRRLFSRFSDSERAPNVPSFEQPKPKTVSNKILSKPDKTSSPSSSAFSVFEPEATYKAPVTKSASQAAAAKANSGLFNTPMYPEMETRQVFLPQQEFPSDITDWEKHFSMTQALLGQQESSDEPRRSFFRARLLVADNGAPQSAPASCDNDPSDAATFNELLKQLGAITAFQGVIADVPEEQASTLLEKRNSIVPQDISHEGPAKYLQGDINDKGARASIEILHNQSDLRPSITEIDPVDNSGAVDPSSTSSRRPSFFGDDFKLPSRESASQSASRLLDMLTRNTGCITDTNDPNPAQPIDRKEAAINGAEVPSTIPDAQVLSKFVSLSADALEDLFFSNPQARESLTTHINQSALNRPDTFVHSSTGVDDSSRNSTSFCLRRGNLDLVGTLSNIQGEGGSSRRSLALQYDLW